MAEMTGYSEGVPCWVDPGTPDLGGTNEFYASVFGYEYEIVPDPADASREYAMIKVEGRPIGGIAEQPAFIPAGTPSYWNTCFSVTDADAAARTVEQVGGRIVQPAAAAPYGRQAVIRDNGGALIVLVASGEG